ncbi:M1 family metallopeptidase [Plantactinospora sp. GCM10030261]|uniref:M1 family metallopeptidase n=1 Tax=Plantactinospora sp. GCM10030261 TaxID=3273420 RepID=UPI0036097490
MGASRRAVGLLLAVALGVTGCTSDESPGPSSSTPAAEPSRDFVTGAAGAGDDYFPSYGNGGYEVVRYDLKVKYDPATDELTGTAGIEANATENLARFNLDLAGLTVRSVTVNGAAAKHAREGNELVVTPAAGLVAGEGFTAEIGYGGKPAPLENETLGSGGFLHTSDGGIALGQPESASTWFPVNDHPSDKAQYRYEITVPDGLVAVSNGKPAGKRAEAGWTTWSWDEPVPMASYLSTVVIGKYRVTTGEHKGRPVFSAISADLPKGGPSDRSIAATTKVADYLETVFGPYPASAYGGVVITDDRIRYALETQSRPVYSVAFFRQGENPDVVAHELAHQWFGNSVALRRWQDIWLNEGLATYAEWLWAEHDGRSTAAREFSNAYDRSRDAIWTVPPGKPGSERLFSGSVYQRGGMTVHALRVAIGDDAFFRFLKAWTAAKRDGYATTDEFIAEAERISGKQLDKLFDAWLYGTTKPPAPKPL